MAGVNQAGEILTVREAAARLKCSRQTVDRMIDEGLPHHVIRRSANGRCMKRIMAGDLEDFFAGRRLMKLQDVTRYRRAPRRELDAAQ